MSKKYVLIDASPRKGGNSEVIVDLLAKELSDFEVTVFKINEKSWNPCLACNYCMEKGEVCCKQNDDLAKLLPKLEEADGIIITGPIYFGSISGQAKSIIDRFYAFFDPTVNGMSKSKKHGKKAAMLFCCGSGPVDKYKEQLNYLVNGFAVSGASEMKTEIFGGLLAVGAIKQKPEYLDKIKEIAGWLKA